MFYSAVEKLEKVWICSCACRHHWHSLSWAHFSAERTRITKSLKRQNVISDTRLHFVSHVRRLPSIFRLLSTFVNDWKGRREILCIFVSSFQFPPPLLYLMLDSRFRKCCESVTLVPRLHCLLCSFTCSPFCAYLVSFHICRCISSFESRSPGQGAEGTSLDSWRLTLRRLSSPIYIFA